MCLVRQPEATSPRPSRAHPCPPVEPPCNCHVTARGASPPETPSSRSKPPAGALAFPPPSPLSPLSCARLPRCHCRSAQPPAQDCYMTATRPLHDCYMVVARLLRDCYIIAAVFDLLVQQLHVLSRPPRIGAAEPRGHLSIHRPRVLPLANIREAAARGEAERRRWAAAWMLGEGRARVSERKGRELSWRKSLFCRESAVCASCRSVVRCATASSSTTCIVCTQTLFCDHSAPSGIAGRATSLSLRFGSTA